MPDFSVVSNEVRVRAAAECLLAPLGVLFEKDTIADCMTDETIRPYFGKTLQRELMPLLPKDGLTEAVIAACRFLETKSVSPTVDSVMDGLLTQYCLHILPHVTAQTPGLIFSLAALLMLLSGVRKQDNGFELIGSKGDKLTLCKDQEALSSLARLSCDMPPEMLAYAALSDASIWGRDLRAVEGLEEKLTNQLTDIQLLGLQGALLRV